MKKKSITLILGLFIIISLVLITAISWVEPSPVFVSLENGSTYYNDTPLFVNVSSTHTDQYFTLVENGDEILFWISMNEVNGTGALVDIKNGYNFTNISNPIQEAGKFGDATFFDATDSYYRLSPASPYFGNNGSLSFWFKPNMLYNSTTTVDNYKTMVCAGSSYICIRIYPSGSDKEGQLSFKLKTLPSEQYLNSPQTSWDKDQWYHSVSTFEYNGTDTNMKLYIDGVEVGNASFAGVTTPLPGSQYWTIGGYNTFSTTKLFNGSIDEVIAINRTLSPSEVLSLYNASANQYENYFTGLVLGEQSFTAYSENSTGSFGIESVSIYISEPLPVLSADDFTIVVIPDTQDYVRDGNLSRVAFYNQQMQWIVDNADALNIKFVQHVGDLVYHPLHEYEWNYSSIAQEILDDSSVPNGIIPGNHEHNNYGIGGATDISPFFDKYFPVSRYSGNPWFGGNKTETMEFNYNLLTINGQDYIFMNLGWCPHQDEVDWASEILTNYSERKAIFTTHAYLDETTSSTQSGVKNCDRYGTGNTTYIWDMLKTHSNVQIVISGHEHDGTPPNDGEANLTSLNDAGVEVHQMMTSYQDYPNGGDGWLRLLIFRPLEDVIEVRTFSTLNLTYKTEVKSNLNFSYPLSVYINLSENLIQYTLNENNGTVANDISGNSNNGLITGATWGSDGIPITLIDLVDYIIDLNTGLFTLLNDSYNYEFIQVIYSSRDFSTYGFHASMIKLLAGFVALIVLIFTYAIVKKIFDESGVDV